jgi:hypothetical protein
MPPPPQPAASSWTDDFLQPMRSVGDAPADRVVESLFQGNGIGPVNLLMSNLVRNEDANLSELPPVVSDYLSSTESLPDWADPDKIEAGERVFWRYGPRLILILHCYSLPFCYAGRNGVQVLALTGRLTGNPARRVLETAQMLVDVMQPGGLTTPEGRGRRTLQKVRLMHAAVRRMAGMAPSWKPEFGLPINQEDIAGTLMSFSWIALDGLAKLGIDVPAQDKDAYLHCWQIVGHQLGLRDDLNPGDLSSAGALAEAVAQHQFASCPEGQEMTQALVKYMEYALPGDLLDHVPSLLIRYFLGEDRAAIIGIHEAMADLLAGPLRFTGMVANELLGTSAAVNQLAEKVGNLLINSIVLIGRGGTRPSFRIPDELRQAWGVNWTS